MLLNILRKKIYKICLKREIDPMFLCFTFYLFNLEVITFLV